MAQQKIDSPTIRPGEVYEFKTPFGENGLWLCIDIMQARYGNSIYDYLGMTNAVPESQAPKDISEFNHGKFTFYYETGSLMFYKNLRSPKKTSHIKDLTSSELASLYEMIWQRRYYNYLVGEIKDHYGELILGQLYDFYKDGEEESTCGIVLVKQNAVGKIDGFITVPTTGGELYCTPSTYDLTSVQNYIKSGQFKPTGFLNAASFHELSMLHDISTCKLLEGDYTIDMHELVEEAIAAKQAAEQSAEETEPIAEEEKPKPKRKRSSKKKKEKEEE